jgi:hypothetical protein
MRHRWSDDMGATWFDVLTKRLSGMPSRRQVVKGLGGGLAAAFGATLATNPAAADCRDDGADCKKGGQCCSGLCARVAGAPANSCECLAPATCGGGGTPATCGTPTEECTPSGTACDPNAFVVPCCSKVCQRNGYQDKDCPGGDPHCCL